MGPGKGAWLPAATLLAFAFWGCGEEEKKKQSPQRRVTVIGQAVSAGPQGGSGGLVIGRPRLDGSQPPTAVAQAPTTCAGVAAVPTAAAPETLSEAVRCLMNAERAARGLKVLRANAGLAAAARRHAGDMVRGGYFSHTSPAGTTFVARVLRAGYRPAALGENIAAGVGRLATPEATVQKWMGSPPHRANILGRRYREAGVGMFPRFAGGDAVPGGGTYVAVFGAGRR
jgi:uncharacterized protein YkwD